MELFGWFLDPLGYSFVVRALLAAIVVGIVCSVLGTYIVLQGMAFSGMLWLTQFYLELSWLSYWAGRWQLAHLPWAFSPPWALAL